VAGIDARLLKCGSIPESCRGPYVRWGVALPSLIIVDQVPPESIRAAMHDIACRALEMHVIAVGTCAVN